MTLPKQQQVELKSGEVYRGTLVEAEDNWNCQLTNVSLTGRDGALFFAKDRCGCRRALRSRTKRRRRPSRMNLFFFLFSLFRVSLCSSSSSSSSDNTIIASVFRRYGILTAAILTLFFSLFRAATKPEI